MTWYFHVQFMYLALEEAYWLWICISPQCSSNNIFVFKEHCFLFFAIAMHKCKYHGHCISSWSCQSKKGMRPWRGSQHSQVVGGWLEQVSLIKRSVTSWLNMWILNEHCLAWEVCLLGINMKTEEGTIWQINNRVYLTGIIANVARYDFHLNRCLCKFLATVI